MCWKKLPAWVKGGVIALAVLVLVYLAALLFESLQSSYEVLVFPLFNIIEFIAVSFGKSLYSYLVQQVSSRVLMTILNLMLVFVIGAYASLIIKDLRTRKKQDLHAFYKGGVIGGVIGIIIALNRPFAMISILDVVISFLLVAIFGMILVFIVRLRNISAEIKGGTIALIIFLLMLLPEAPDILSNLTALFIASIETIRGFHLWRQPAGAVWGWLDILISMVVSFIIGLVIVWIYRQVFVRKEKKNMPVKTVKKRKKKKR
jgi:hypothetical protein